MGKYYQGIFTPKNPSKYVGDVSNIVYRSGWELRLMIKLDIWDTVISWSSEEMAIPYRSPLDKKIHHYYPDIVAKVKKPDGSTGTVMYEIKPYKQTIEPVKGKRTTKRYIREVTTYLVNKAKWDAAEALCQDRGWQFLKITENELNIICPNS